MARHLTTEELIDIAEGGRTGASDHLAACGECRHRVDDLRRTIDAAAAVDVPDPSPLFWEHLSSRVHDAVAAERVPRRTWFRWPPAVRLRPSLAAIAAVAVAFVLGARLFEPHTSAPAARIAVKMAAPAAPSEGDEDLSSDPSLQVVADLMADTDDDSDLADDSPLPLRAGAADHAVTMLTDRERRELERLLKQELERPGA